MIAPFWSDIYLPSGIGDLYYRETADATILGILERVVRNDFEGSCGCSFKAKAAFIATWINVTSFCDSFFIPDEFGRNAVEEPSNATMTKAKAMNDSNAATGRSHLALKRNSFQVAFVTNGARKSYVIITYGDLEWDRCWAQNRVCLFSIFVLQNISMGPTLYMYVNTTSFILMDIIK